MQVDALAIDLRPRSMPEAADLGVRLVQAQARSVWRSFAPVLAAVLLVSLSTVELAGWLPPLILFWLKPWLDRSLLFVLSRAVFGQETRFADLWRERSRVGWQQLLQTLTLRRLSPWRSFTQPMVQLEGQRGAALRARRKQLLRGKRGSAIAMHTAFAHVEAALLVSTILLAMWLAQPVQSNGLFGTFQGGDGVAAAVLETLVYAGVVLLVEPFYVAAGFAMYLNRRVELEAWDIEQEFRRAFGV